MQHEEYVHWCRVCWVLHKELFICLGVQAADVALLQYTLGRTVEQGISPYFLFAFDSAVAATSCAVILLKYCLYAAAIFDGGVVFFLATRSMSNLEGMMLIAWQRVLANF